MSRIKWKQLLVHLRFCFSFMFPIQHKICVTGCSHRF
uniref:Uncharacterized protein n=1 Tax=Triticum urartu TaxID=4572 RepID=A0A8R7QT97_TRIUA